MYSMFKNSPPIRYNKYASICAQTVRKSLKEQARLGAEKRGEMEIKVAKWDNGRSSNSVTNSFRI